MPNLSQPAIQRKTDAYGNYIDEFPGSTYRAGGIQYFPNRDADIKDRQQDFAENKYWQGQADKQKVWDSAGANTGSAVGGVLGGGFGGIGNVIGGAIGGAGGSLEDMIRNILGLGLKGTVNVGDLSMQGNLGPILDFASQRGQSGDQLLGNLFSSLAGHNVGMAGQRNQRNAAQAAQQKGIDYMNLFTTLTGGAPGFKPTAAGNWDIEDEGDLTLGSLIGRGQTPPPPSPPRTLPAIQNRGPDSATMAQNLMNKRSIPNYNMAAYA